MCLQRIVSFGDEVSNATLESGPIELVPRFADVDGDIDRGIGLAFAIDDWRLYKPRQ